MSAVGRCGDSAAAEGFFGMLKRERVNRRRYQTLAEALTDIFNYIERFHNPRIRQRMDTEDRKYRRLAATRCFVVSSNLSTRPRTPLS